MDMPDAELMKTTASLPNAEAERAVFRNSALYRLIAKEMPHGAVFVVDRKMRYVLADGDELKQTGFSPADFEGKTVREAVPAELVEQHERDYRTVLEGGTFAREHTIKQRHYRSHGVPLKDENGDAELALVVSYDITERVRGERHLALLGELGNIVHHHDAGVAGVVADVLSLIQRHAGPVECLVADVVAETSELEDLSGMLERHGLSERLPVDALGKDCLEQLRTGRMVASPEGVACRLLAALGLGSHVVVPALQGDRLVGLLAVGRVDGLPWQEEELAALEMIAERAWSTIERARAVESLQASERHKHEIFALLGHELRNPLTALTSGIGLLQLNANDEQSRKVLGMMDRQTKQIQYLIEDLLGMSYVNFGKLDLRLDCVSVQTLVENVVQMLRPLAVAKEQHLAFAGQPDPLHVRGDRTRLTQVLSNVVSNAIKYTPRGGHIEVTASRSEEHVVLVVSDDGIGLSEQSIRTVFEPFVRGGDRETGPGVAESGLGIGLWVVKRFVEAHGGHVSASSAGPGRGSVFAVSLPLAGPASSE